MISCQNLKTKSKIEKTQDKEWWAISVNKGDIVPWTGTLVKDEMFSLLYREASKD